MFGPNLSVTMGKKVRQNPDRVAMDYVAVSRKLFKLHKFVTLVVDVIFVNSALLFITISRGIKFLVVKHIPTLTVKQLSKYLKG